jgi:hypothetical protein
VADLQIKPASWTEAVLFIVEALYYSDTGVPHQALALLGSGTANIESPAQKSPGRPAGRRTRAEGVDALPYYCAWAVAVGCAIEKFGSGSSARHHFT